MQSTVLRHGQQFQFDLHGEEQCLVLGSELLPALGEVGKDLREREKEMGWKTGAAAGAAAGMWGGPIGAAIGAGVGAFIGNLCDNDADESDLPSIYLTEEGVSFRVAEITIYWSEVLEIEFDNDDGNDVYTFVGGVMVTCPSHLVRFDNEEDADKINKIIRNRKVISIEDSFDAIDDGDSVSSVLDVANDRVASIAICKQHLSALQADENLIVDFLNCAGMLCQLALGIYQVYLNMVLSDEYDAEDTAAVRDWAADNGGDLIELGDYFIQAIAEDDDYSEEVKKSCCALIADYELVIVSALSSRVFDKSDYALFHAAVSTGDSIESNVQFDQCIEWLAREFTKEEYAKERKLILCTDDPRNFSELKTEIPGVAILRADALEMAKDRVNEPFDVSEELYRMENVDKSLPKAKKLEAARLHYEETKQRFFQFEVGHPKSGVTYVQHPLVQNRYIDIQSYNTTLLERKYDELIEILTSIGATRISCSVENEQSRGGKQSRRRNVDGEVNSGVVGGASGSYEGHKFSEKTTALNKRLACSITRNPNQHPCMPEKTIFYPFEDRWQMMVKDVLSGQRTHEEVDLSYKKEYSLSENETRKIAGKVESLIPTFQFGGSANYSDEYEAELRELESIVWHYEVDFGSMKETPSKGQEVPLDKDNDINQGKGSTADVSKAESIIRGRAIRYAKTDEARRTGMLTDAQRADLVRLAEKYGVEEIVLEDIIDEAFV